jgi:hypothetical protein
MSIHVMFVPLFILANQIPSDQPIAHGDSEQPLQKQMPEFYPRISLFGNSWLSFSCDFKNGFQIQGGKYYLPVFLDDHIEHAVTIGPSIDLVSKWYHGHGFESSLTLEFPELECAIGMNWYPFEGIIFSLNLDPVRRQIRFGWELEKPADCLQLVDLVWGSYLLAYWNECQHQAN